MHTSESTYSTLREDEGESFQIWLQNRDIAYLHSLKLNLIKTHPIIQVMYKRLVPKVVTETSFWNYYFYHMEQSGYDFSRHELQISPLGDKTQEQQCKETEKNETNKDSANQVASPALEVLTNETKNSSSDKCESLSKDQFATSRFEIRMVMIV